MCVSVCVGSKLRSRLAVEGLKDQKSIKTSTFIRKWEGEGGISPNLRSLKGAWGAYLRSRKPVLYLLWLGSSMDHI